jgi:hypothetical protein
MPAAYASIAGAERKRARQLRPYGRARRNLADPLPRILTWTRVGSGEGRGVEEGAGESASLKF